MMVDDAWNVANSFSLNTLTLIHSRPNPYHLNTETQKS